MSSKDHFSNRSRLARCLSIWRQLVSRERRSIFYLFVLQIVSAASDVFSLGAIFPFLSAIISPGNEVIPKHFPAFLISFFNSDIVVNTAFLFLLTVLISNCLKIAVSRYQLKLTSNISQTFSKKMLHKFLEQNLQYHLIKGANEHIGLMTHDLNGALGVIQLTFTLVTNLMSCIAIFFALIYVDPFLAISSTFVFVITYVFLVLFNKRKLALNSNIISSNHRTLIKIINESLLNIRDILLDSSQAVFVKEYARYEHEMRSAQNESSLIRQTPRYILEIIGAVIIFSIVFFASISHGDYKDIVPVLGMFAMGSTRLLPALQQVYASISGMQGIGVSLDKTLDCLSLPSPPNLQSDFTSDFNENYEVVLRDLSYGYLNQSGDQKIILNNVNMRMPMNSTVAIIGKSGSGKSTIADIMLGLLRPSSGSLVVGGETITDANLKLWKNHVSYVPQSIFLIEGTIAQNIAFGCPENLIDYARVIQSAKLACINDFIETLELGYRSMLGDTGLHLSGGQKQRIGIARALYKGSKFLLLDEATSALDYETEASVMTSIKKISGLLSIVIITHKISNIDDCSIIYQIKDGYVTCVNGLTTLPKN
ncbi:ABC transporter ATP-binding protein [Mesorhizobium japonicum]|uniref:ABC transporter ATP-binding protein n=1 Tax=Mesorhizobium japonicum TaxID=2066070 RepID=UPI003B5B68B5